MPDGWDENSDRLQQIDLDARWVQKNGINYYGYTTSTCIEVNHGFIRRYAVIPANVHDSQMLQHYSIQKMNMTTSWQILHIQANASRVC